MGLSVGSGSPPRTDADAPAAPSLARRFWPVAAIGLAGVAALLLQPVPPDIVRQAPALAGWPPLAVKALLALNPAVLVLVAAVVGALLAHRVGLRSLLAGTAHDASWRRTLGRSAAIGVALGLVLGAVDALWLPHLGDAWRRLVAAQPAGAAALAGAMLYGGLAEEVMLRWGVMGLVGWALVAGPRLWRSGAAMPWAIAVAAALFALAHLPALAAQAEATPALVLRTLLLNGAAGLVYGWLFWRRHLEAAMAAHGATHLGLAGWRVLAG